MGTEAERAATVCEVCRRGLRPQEVEHCDGLCSQCFHIAQGSQPCACGHDRTEHFPSRCAHWHYNAMLAAQVPCRCTGFQEAA